MAVDRVIGDLIRVLRVSKIWEIRKFGRANVASHKVTHKARWLILFCFFVENARN